jgi:hypothetical protein
MYLTIRLFCVNPHIYVVCESLHMTEYDFRGPLLFDFHIFLPVVSICFICTCHSQKDISDRKVFVRQISFETTTDTLRAHFQPFGDIEVLLNSNQN